MDIAFLFDGNPSSRLLPASFNPLTVLEETRSSLATRGVSTRVLSFRFPSCRDLLRSLITDLDNLFNGAQRSIGLTRRKVIGRPCCP